MNTEEVKKRILQVLERGYLLSLGTLDDGGVWVADVIYIHEDSLNIYWKSFADTRHSQAITKNKKVAGTITVNGKDEDDLGIQFEGFAQKIDAERYDLAKIYSAKRDRSEPKESDDVLHGRSWYVLKPSKIQLIDKVNLGINKITLELK